MTDENGEARDTQGPVHSDWVSRQSRVTANNQIQQKGKAPKQGNHSKNITKQNIVCQTRGYDHATARLAILTGEWRPEGSRDSDKGQKL